MQSELDSFKYVDKNIIKPRKQSKMRLTTMMSMQILLWIKYVVPMLFSLKIHTKITIIQKIKYFILRYIITASSMGHGGVK